MTKYILFVFTIIHLNVTQAQWLNSLPNSHQYNVIKFSGNQKGWIMGNECIIEKTADLGDTWTETQCDVLVDIKNFQFLNDSIGYAVGFNYMNQASPGKVLKTIDRGNRWDSIFTTSGSIQSVKFKDSQTGFMVGSEGIFNTHDGGSNWDIIWTFSEAGFQYGELFSIAFLNDSIGFASGIKREDIDFSNSPLQGFILKTIDSGRSWLINYESSGTDYYQSLQIISDSLCNIYAHDGKSGILISNDCGISWHTYSISNNILKGISIRDIFFTSKDTAYAALSTNLISTSSNDYSFLEIHKSTDGGKVWHLQYIDSFAQTSSYFTFEDMYFIDEKIGYVVGYKKTLKTTNSGGSIIVSHNISNLDLYTPPSIHIASSKMTISYNPSHSLPLNCSIYNLYGQLILKQVLPYNPHGIYHLNPQINSDGVYILEINNYKQKYISKHFITLN